MIHAAKWLLSAYMVVIVSIGVVALLGYVLRSIGEGMLERELRAREYEAHLQSDFAVSSGTATRVLAKKARTRLWGKAILVYYIVLGVVLLATAL
jgi:hypothetical protein